MSGHYRMARGWQNHDAFSGEPFSKRDAWVWMIERAAWKATRHIVAGKLVPLHRGQFAASLRQMAEAWGWGHERVRRFLGLLSRDAMIATATETGKYVVSICNYDKYQATSIVDETVGETTTRQQRDSSETLKKEGKEGKKEEVPPLPPQGAGSEAEFDEFWRAYPRREDRGHASKAFAKARKRTAQAVLVAGAERYAKERRGQDPKYTALAATWLTGERWADETAAPVDRYPNEGVPPKGVDLAERYPNEGVYH